MGATMKRDERLGLLLALIGALGFSLKAIFIKLAYPHGVDAVTLLALRMAFSLPVFLWAGLIHRHGGAPLTAGDLWRLFLLGFLGYYGASILDFWGLQYISAGLERLILFTYPTLTLLIGVLFQGRPFTRRELLAVVLCYAGIGFAFVHDLAFADARSVLIGGSLVFASSVSYALYLTGSGAMIQRLGSMRFSALAMLMSTGVTLLHFAFSQPLTALHQPWPVYGWAFAMAAFSTVIPVFALGAAIRRLGAGRAALYGMVGPILTIAFGWLMLAEPVSGAQLAGAALVVAGVVVVSRSGSTK